MSKASTNDRSSYQNGFIFTIWEGFIFFKSSLKNSKDSILMGIVKSLSKINYLQQEASNLLKGFWKSKYPRLLETYFLILIRHVLELIDHWWIRSHSKFLPPSLRLFRFGWIHNKRSYDTPLNPKLFTFWKELGSYLFSVKIVSFKYLP